MQAPDQPDARRRLIEAFVAAIADKGYAAATIADIARHARVSKRTFYEHFEDKEACLLATYVEATSLTRAAMRAAFLANRERGWREQIEGVLDAYVGALESSPALTRACLVEMAAAGPQALKRRREEHEAFAGMLRDFVEAVRRESPDVPPMSRALATAIVGGIDELLLAEVERGPRARLGELRATASELLRAVLGRGERQARPHRSPRPARAKTRPRRVR